MTRRLSPNSPLDTSAPSAVTLESVRAVQPPELPAMPFAALLGSVPRQRVQRILLIWLLLLLTFALIWYFLVPDPVSGG